MIDGTVFKPWGVINRRFAKWNLSVLTPGASNGYTFGVSAKNQKDNCFYKTAAFGFDNLAMNIGIYSLENRGNGYGGGTYQEFPCGQPFIELMTNDLVKGELDLKKFDTVNQIASGTFWFTAVNDKGDTVKVTNGRFDVHYTR